MSFTGRVRDELAHLTPGRTDERAAETAALLRFGGALSLQGGSPLAAVGHVFTSDSGAVTRRLHGHVRHLSEVRPEIEVHQPSGLRRTLRYRLRLEAARGLLTALGILDPDGRPTEPARPRPDDAATVVRGYVRGALMAAGSISQPRGAPHAEVAGPGEGAALHLAALLAVVGAPGSRPGVHGEGWRVVLKSGSEIATVLATVGAHTSYLEWDDAVLRRELRGEANRVANADRANLARAVAASARQVEAIGRLVDDVGWEGIPDGMRAVALARLANPQASLAELGALLDPPLGKVAVHRRLARLLALTPEV